MNFKGKVAVITGAMSGIGKTTALILGKYGATIIVADIQEPTGDSVITELQAKGITAKYVNTDITNTEKISALFSQAVATFGTVDILVNCAGIGRLTKVPYITSEEWDLVMSVNLKSAFFCSQEALKVMCNNKNGKIINLSSAAGKIGGVAVGAHYSASKAAIICLTKSLALYAAQYQVQVNCVCPGPIATPLTDDWGDDLNAAFAEKIPLKRYGTTKEVAEAICFLASDKADYITGETLDVNGGLVMD
jgi:3-oxoacyl-[acyl-carrier protein] reductase